VDADVIYAVGLGCYAAGERCGGRAAHSSAFKSGACHGFGGGFGAEFHFELLCVARRVCAGLQGELIAVAAGKACGGEYEPVVGRFGRCAHIGALVVRVVLPVLAVGREGAVADVFGGTAELGGVGRCNGAEFEARRFD